MGTALNKNVLVSIIVPVYNAKDTLRECIDSILRQNYRDFELLLIDDGSTDGSNIICEEYALLDNRVQVFHKSNGGVSSARNVGLDHAKGEWITFVDSDDFLMQDYFNIDFNNNWDLIIGKFDVCIEGNIVTGVTSQRLFYISNIHTFIESFLNTPILRGPVFKFYRKQLLEDIRFNELMSIGEDSEFVMRYLRRCESYNICDTGRYIVRMGNVSMKEKYSVSVDYAAQSLTYLKESYAELSERHHIRHKYFKEFLVFFKLISSPDWRNSCNRWYTNDIIKRCYSYIWADISFFQKCQIVIGCLKDYVKSFSYAKKRE